MSKIALHLFHDDQVLIGLGGIYEHSTWVAKALLAGGITQVDNDPDHLAQRMKSIVDVTSDEAKLTLLRAHPELAGKLAVAGNLTAESTAEQAGADLDKCSAEEFEQFQRLNTDYTVKFGHPFIIAVRGLSRTDILAAFHNRIGNDPATEFKTAIDEVHKIAKFRILELFTGADD